MESSISCAFTAARESVSLQATWHSARNPRMSSPLAVLPNVLSRRRPTLWCKPTLRDRL